MKGICIIKNRCILGISSAQYDCQLMMTRNRVSLLIFHNNSYWIYFIRFQDRKCFLSNLVIIHWYDLPCLILLMHTTFKTTEERSNVVMVVGCWFRCRATKNIYLFPWHYKTTHLKTHCVIANPIFDITPIKVGLARQYC